MEEEEDDDNVDSIANDDNYYDHDSDNDHDHVDQNKVDNNDGDNDDDIRILMVEDIRDNTIIFRRLR